MSTVGFMLFLGISATIACTVLAYIFIIPEKKRENLKKFGRFLHDLANFKFLFIEKVQQFMYVLSSIACVCIGVCMLFGFDFYRYYTRWYGWQGLLVAILGPIALRLVYEGLMLGLLLVKNVIQINKKMKSSVEEETFAFPKFKELVSKEACETEETNE